MKQKNFRFSIFRRKTKSQIHIGENVAILFIFFILLVVSLVFYARLTETQIGVKQEEKFAAKALDIAQRTAYLPETQCSKDNVVENNCYDLHKMQALANLANENRAHYFNMFGYANITIESIFPQEWRATIYSNVPAKMIEKQSVQIPVSICDFTKPTAKCFFAVMTVDVFR